MKTTKLLFCVGLLFCVATNSYASSDPEAPVVRISSGMVKGIHQEGTMAFLGIPYAKIERFMPPQPVDA
ncbi:MAG: carboxylesterase family protein [Prevotella sp.]|nr:carboxylesterase family protein [Prevotella sp.]